MPRKADIQPKGRRPIVLEFHLRGMTKSNDRDKENVGRPKTSAAQRPRQTHNTTRAPIIAVMYCISGDGSRPNMTPR